MGASNTWSMDSRKRVEEIQRLLLEAGIDGWLFYQFQSLDPIADRLLLIPQETLQTRRWFYLIAASGEPGKLVHKIEPNALNHLPGREIFYAGWRELEAGLAFLLKGLKRVAMQYSPRGAIPYVSKVDAGTVELVRGTGVDVVSSGNLLQAFEATWTPEQLQSHLEAARILREIVFQTFEKARSAMVKKKPLSEYDLQEFILERFKAKRLLTSHPPIVAVNLHTANPHYLPTRESSFPIRKGDLLLLDLWAKKRDPEAVYADTTWTGVLAESPTERQREVFEVVRGARDAAIDFVRGKVRQGEQILGFQVDDVARGVIHQAGYGPYFLHRTGHSIGAEAHWNGANVDNFETRDERQILPHTCFSIEPGIYLEEFGIRSEIDLYVGDGEVLVTPDPPQEELIPILAL